MTIRNHDPRFGFIPSWKLELREVRRGRGGFYRVGRDGKKLSYFNQRGELVWLDEAAWWRELQIQHPKRFKETFLEDCHARTR